MDEEKRIENIAKKIRCNAIKMAEIAVKNDGLVLKLKRYDELALYSHKLKKHELTAS